MTLESSSTRFSFGLRTVIAMLVLLASTSPGSAQAADTQHDVVIVGAGAAGLYAAYTLNNLGFDVLVLEALDRRGGRVHSARQHDADFWTASSELGAEEVESNVNSFLQDDINANYPGRITPAYDFDKNAKLTFESTWEAAATVVYPGNSDAPQEIYDYWDFYYHIEEGGDHPAGVSILQDLADHVGVTPEDDSFHLYVSSPGSSFQAKLGEMETRSFGRQEQLWPYGSGTNVFAESGYLETLDVLYFDEINGRVLLNSLVTEINTEAGPRPYAVVGDDKHYADAIVITVSAGVINAGNIRFVPPLPQSKLDAYATLNMPVGGRGAKVILKWDSVFWGKRIEFMITDGPASACWSQGFRKNLPDEEKLVWACLIAPDAYESYLSPLATEQEKINAVASDFLETWSARVPTPTLANLDQAIFEDWGENPTTLGSYSSPGAGSYPDAGPSMREVAGQPIGTQLYFAGEATNPAGPAVVIGAMETGERAALEVDADHVPLPEPEVAAQFATAIGVVSLLGRMRRRREGNRGL